MCSFRQMPSKMRSSRKIDSDIRKQQQSTKNVIPHTSFQRLVAEIIQDSRSQDQNFCVREEAVSALQCEAETFLTQVFTEARKLAEYNNRDTVTQGDLRFVLDMKGFGSIDGTCNEMQLPSTDPCETPSG